MKFVILLILSNIGFVLSFPGNHKYPAIENVYNAESKNEQVNEDVGHRIFKKSISAHPSYFENLVNLEGAAQEPCRLSLPTIDLSAMEIPQDFYGDDEVQDLPTEVMPPRIPSILYNPPFNKWMPYDSEYFIQVPAYDRPSYNSYNMPYIYPNSVPPVRSLPPVISTHIHETIPEVPEIDGFDVNGLSDNYFTPYVRAVRSRDQDFLEQLEKDAMIPNLLPTMPFPYMRSDSQPNYRSSLYGKTGPVAMFPSGSESDCALPFLLSCTPRVNHGILTNNVYGNPLHSALATNKKGDAVRSNGKGH